MNVSTADMIIAEGDNMETNDELNGKMLSDLSELAKLRTEQDNLQYRHNQAYEAWKAANAPLLEREGVVVQEIERLQQAIRMRGSELYARLQTKKLAGGVGVREKVVLEYKPEDAMKYAKDHNLFIVPETLDKKAFEAYAKDIELPFVVYKKQVQVTIPADIQAVV